jgi:hypothetical protein
MRSGAALGRAGANAGMIKSGLQGLNSQGYGAGGKNNFWSQFGTGMLSGQNNNEMNNQYR